VWLYSACFTWVCFPPGSTNVIELRLSRFPEGQEGLRVAGFDPHADKYRVQGGAQISIDLGSVDGHKDHSCTEASSVLGVLAKCAWNLGFGSDSFWGDAESSGSPDARSTFGFSRQALPRDITTRHLFWERCRDAICNGAGCYTLFCALSYVLPSAVDFAVSSAYPTLHPQEYQKLKLDVLFALLPDGAGAEGPVDAGVPELQLVQKSGDGQSAGPAGGAADAGGAGEAFAGPAAGPGAELVPPKGSSESNPKEQPPPTLSVGQERSSWVTFFGKMLVPTLLGIRAPSLSAEARVPAGAVPEVQILGAVPAVEVAGPEAQVPESLPSTGDSRIPTAEQDVVSPVAPKTTSDQGVSPGFADPSAERFFEAMFPNRVANNSRQLEQWLRTVFNKDDDFGRALKGPFAELFRFLLELTAEEASERGLAALLGDPEFIEEVSLSWSGWKEGARRQLAQIYARCRLCQAEDRAAAKAEKDRPAGLEEVDHSSGRTLWAKSLSPEQRQCRYREAKGYSGVTRGWRPFCPDILEVKRGWFDEVWDILERRVGLVSGVPVDGLERASLLDLLSDNPLGAWRTEIHFPVVDARMVGSFGAQPSSWSVPPHSRPRGKLGRWRRAIQGKSVARIVREILSERRYHAETVAFGGESPAKPATPEFSAEQDAQHAMIEKYVADGRAHLDFECRLVPEYGDEFARVLSGRVGLNGEKNTSARVDRSEFVFEVPIAPAVYCYSVDTGARTQGDGTVEDPVADDEAPLFLMHHANGLKWTGSSVEDPTAFRGLANLIEDYVRGIMEFPWVDGVSGGGVAGEKSSSAKKSSSAQSSSAPELLDPFSPNYARRARFLFFEYPGYSRISALGGFKWSAGRSESGTRLRGASGGAFSSSFSAFSGSRYIEAVATEDGLYAAAEAAYRVARTRLGITTTQKKTSSSSQEQQRTEKRESPEQQQISPENIFAVGESLGTGVASELYVRQPRIEVDLWHEARSSKREDSQEGGSSQDSQSSAPRPRLRPLGGLILIAPLASTLRTMYAHVVYHVCGKLCRWSLGLALCCARGDCLCCFWDRFVQLSLLFRGGLVSPSDDEKREPGGSSRGQKQEPDSESRAEEAEAGEESVFGPSVVGPCAAWCAEYAIYRPVVDYFCEFLCRRPCWCLAETAFLTRSILWTCCDGETANSPVMVKRKRRLCADLIPCGGLLGASFASSCCTCLDVPVELQTVSEMGNCCSIDSLNSIDKLDAFLTRAAPGAAPGEGRPDEDDYTEIPPILIVHSPEDKIVPIYGGGGAIYERLQGVVGVDNTAKWEPLYSTATTPSNTVRPGSGGRGSGTPAKTLVRRTSGVDTYSGCAVERVLTHLHGFERKVNYISMTNTPATSAGHNGLLKGPVVLAFVDAVHRNLKRRAAKDGLSREP